MHLFENMHKEKMLREDPRAAALPQRHHQDGRVGGVRGGPGTSWKRKENKAAAAAAA